MAATDQSNDLTAEDLETLLEAAETEEDIAEVERLIAERCQSIVATLAEVATLCEVSLPTVWTWRAAADPMPGSPGCWDMKAIRAWRAKREAKRNGGDEAASERLAVEIDGLKASIELSECKLAEMTASLITKSAALRGLKLFQADVEEILAPIAGLLTDLTPEDCRKEIAITAKQQVELILAFVNQKFAELRAAVNE